jgi:hypothetical protein
LKTLGSRLVAQPWFPHWFPRGGDARKLGCQLQPTGKRWMYGHKDTVEMDLVKSRGVV